MVMARLGWEWMARFQIMVRISVGRWGKLGNVVSSVEFIMGERWRRGGGRGMMAFFLDCLAILLA